jgi:hypothetical protein
VYVRSTDGNGQRSYNGVKRTAFRDFLFNPAYLADTKHGKTFHHFTHSALLHIKKTRKTSALNRWRQRPENCPRKMQVTSVWWHESETGLKQIKSVKNFLY